MNLHSLVTSLHSRMNCESTIPTLDSDCHPMHLSGSQKIAACSSEWIQRIKVKEFWRAEGLALGIWRGNTLELVQVVLQRFTKKTSEFHHGQTTCRGFDTQWSMNVSFWTRLWACIIQTLQHQSKQNWIFQIKTLYQLCQASGLSLSSIGMWVIITFWQHIYKSFENMQLLHWSFLVFISSKLSNLVPSRGKIEVWAYSFVEDMNWPWASLQGSVTSLSLSRQEQPGSGLSVTTPPWFSISQLELPCRTRREKQNHNHTHWFRQLLHC